MYFIVLSTRTNSDSGSKQIKKKINKDRPSVYQYLVVSSVLRLQTGVPTDTIARRIRVKRVGRDDGARRMRRSSRSRSRVRERQGKNKSSARVISPYSLHTDTACNRVCRYPGLQSEHTGHSCSADVKKKIKTQGTKADDTIQNRRS